MHVEKLKNSGLSEVATILLIVFLTVYVPFVFPMNGVDFSAIGVFIYIAVLLFWVGVRIARNRSELLHYKQMLPADGIMNNLKWMFLLFGLQVVILLACNYLRRFGFYSYFIFNPPFFTPGSKGAGLLYGVVIGAIAEELFFRGYLFRIQERVFQNYTWLANAIAFVLVHSFAMYDIAFRLLSDLLISYYFQKKRNLIVVMVVHILWNLAGYWVM
jgi:membrane protease YdiL (CAAX protease family)